MITMMCGRAGGAGTGATWLRGTVTAGRALGGGVVTGTGEVVAGLEDVELDGGAGAVVVGTDDVTGAESSECSGMATLSRPVEEVTKNDPTTSATVRAVSFGAVHRRALRRCRRRACCGLLPLIAATIARDRGGDNLMPAANPERASERH
jgi:hypothetical protein